MQEVSPRPNVELRVAPSGEPVVAFGFPYRADLVDAMRAIPGRRFDWDRKEWIVPRTDVAAIYVADTLRRWPELVAQDEVHAWLAAAPRRWLGRVTVRKRRDSGQFLVRTLAGPLPEELEPHVVEALSDRDHVLPFNQEAADTLL